MIASTRREHQPDSEHGLTPKNVSQSKKSAHWACYFRIVGYYL